MFGELFSYLKDKEISTELVKNWTPFPSAEFDALVAESPQHKLTKSISPNTLPRSARQGVTGVDASQLHMNGVSAGKVEMVLPIFIALKGKIDGARSTAGTSGTVAYKLGNTVFGLIQAYANTGDGFEVVSHQSETSVAVSQSLGSVFLEGQVGYIVTQNVHNADMSGNRYQLSVGFDTQYVSPFVQVVYRDFGAVNNTAAYVGAELNLDKLTMDSYSLDMSLTAKAGYDSKKEFVGSAEWSASLNLNSGISFKTDLTLGTNEGSAYGLNASISR
jgi:hypothetical protein